MKSIIEESNRGANLGRLNTSQRAFVLEMLASKDMNATEAARLAGYKNPSQAANKLLKNPAVKALIGKQQKRMREKAEVKADDIVQQLANVAFFDPADLCDEEGYIRCNIHEIPKVARLCLEGGLEVTDMYTPDGDLSGRRIKINIASRLKAIELLMKHFGMLANSQELEKQKIDWDELYGEDPRKNLKGDIESRLIEEESA